MGLRERVGIECGNGERIPLYCRYWKDAMLPDGVMHTRRMLAQHAKEVEVPETGNSRRRIRRPAIQIPAPRLLSPLPSARRLDWTESPGTPRPNLACFSPVYQANLESKMESLESRLNS